MGKHLVLVGGGHAHLMTLASVKRLVRRGHRVTVIGPSEHHYYSGMGPGMLGRFYEPEEIRFATRRMVENQDGIFVRAKVTRIDPKKQTIETDAGRTIPYDVVSFNAGSDVPCDMVADTGATFYATKPIEKLQEARRNLVTLSGHQQIKVAVVGGGAAAVEIAGNIRRLLHHHSRKNFEVHLFTLGKLLARFPSKVREVALLSLRSNDIKVHEHYNVSKIKGNRIDFKVGGYFRADFIFLAAGVKPPSIFADSGLPTGPDGGLAVNRFLQCPSYPNIFGGGDCIYFQSQPLEKVGVYAVRQNPVLLHNLKAALEGTALEAFAPGGAYMLILNLGDRTGLLYKWGLLINGRVAFLIKDYIDRRFMRKFQTMRVKPSF